MIKPLPNVLTLGGRVYIKNYATELAAVYGPYRHANETDPPYRIYQIDRTGGQETLGELIAETSELDAAVGRAGQIQP
jgi:delta-aminolevulinic acid dehydratase/porphobilinogen synthase